MPLNILYILASPSWGGGEQYVADLALNLPREAFRPVLILPKNNVFRERAESIAGTQAVYELPMRTMADVYSAVCLARILRHERIDIIHVNKFADAFIAQHARRLSGRPEIRIVLTRHLVRRGKDALPYRYLYRHLDRILFVSQLAREAFYAGNPSMDRTRTEVVHNSIADRPAPPRIPSADGRVRIAFAGRLAEEKGLDTLLDALALLPDLPLRLRLAGTGDEAYVKHLQAHAAAPELAGRVEFCGFAADVPAFLADADIGVLPSLAAESFGLSLLEYMRAGLPSVTTDNGAQREFLREGITALFVPPGDAPRLAAALESLAGDAAMRERMGCAAREQFREQLAYGPFLHRMETIYRTLASERPPAGHTAG